MKIKKFKFRQILKLNLLNSRMYENPIKKTDSSFSPDFNIIKALSDFKRILNVIYQFHYANKKILFVGSPTNFEFKINRLTHHVAVPNNFELQGLLLSNLKQQKRAKMRNKAFSNFYLRSLHPKLTDRPDLIVIFSHEKTRNLLNESYVAKVPVINFDFEGLVNEFLLKSLYKVQLTSSNSVSVFDKSLFFLGLNFLFTENSKKKRN